MRRFLVLGVGGLGSAIAKSLLRSGIKSDNLILVDRRPHQGAIADELSGCRVQERIPDGLRLKSGDILVLAVKPQDAERACSGVFDVLSPDASVVSVMAGVSVSTLRTFLRHAKVVRVMPNLGATVGESATVYFTPAEIESTDVEAIEGFLACIGRFWRVSEERLIDAATAVAGSGPAYICWLAEQMEHVARTLGISESDARALVLQTLKATTAYVEASGQTFVELRTRVTSPGGTTAAALGVLEQRGADEIVRDAITAAFTRAQQLGQ